MRLLQPGGEEVARLTLLRARAVAVAGGARPGQIGANALITTGGNGAVEILDLQPEGKRSMSLAEFRNGRPWAAGMTLEPLA